MQSPPCLAVGRLNNALAIRNCYRSLLGVRLYVPGFFLGSVETWERCHVAFLYLETEVYFLWVYLHVSVLYAYPYSEFSFTASPANDIS